MTAVFADSSALVKLYADESGADAVRSLSGLVASQLARVEVPAAIWRKHRTGELSATSAGLLVAAFEADYFGTVDGAGEGTGDSAARFLVVAITPEILDHAARLVAAHGLRTYDGVQLASACAVDAVLPDGAAFAAFDKSLRAAAAAEGLALAGPEPS